MSKMMGSVSSLSRQIAGMTSFVDQLYGSPRRELVKRAETAIEHLVRLTWLEKIARSGEVSGLRLTDLGRALLRDRETDATDEDVSVVVLEAHDPLAYPLLVGQLANAGAGLLVDPYLKLDGLHRIIVSTQLSRLLVSVKSGKSELSAMQTHLDSASLGRRVEVRKSTKLHDRYLIADDNSVFTLGTSLNGVGRTTTVFTPMPEKAAAVLREEYEQLWDNAELVGPQPISDNELHDEDQPAADESKDETADDKSDLDPAAAENSESEQPERSDNCDQPPFA